MKGLLQKLDAFRFNYQHMDCLYRLFKYKFSGEIVVKSVQLFDIVQRSVHFNKQKRGGDRVPSIAKKKLLRKKYKNHLLSFFRSNLTQTSRSVFADRIENFGKTKLELELIKVADCFLDDHGKHTGRIVSFKIKFL